MFYYKSTHKFPVQGRKLRNLGVSQLLDPNQDVFHRKIFILGQYLHEDIFKNETKRRKEKQK